jgi:flavin reductase (DIM6/NTAB) family NADH-FMN oxidoreductase RutF
MALSLQKDTYANIKATGEFTVNILSEWFVEAANHTCGEYPPDVSEWHLSGLTAVPSVKVKPPRVAESAINMVCSVS